MRCLQSKKISFEGQKSVSNLVQFLIGKIYCANSPQKDEKRGREKLNFEVKTVIPQVVVKQLKIVSLKLQYEEPQLERRPH